MSGEAQAKPGRNDPCTCGSGKKYKKCCGAESNGHKRESPSRPSASLPRPELERLGGLIRAGLHGELEARARELLGRHPNDGTLWKVLGAALKLQGKEALPELRRAAELLPQDVEAHGNLGNALRAANQLEAARQSHERALEIDPRSPDAHNNLGSVLLDLGKLEEAGAHFRRAVSLRPAFALAHSNLSQVLLLQNRVAEAEESCRRALDIDPRLIAAILQDAELHAGKGRFADAENLIRRALGLNPASAEALAGLVRFRRMGPGDEEWLERARSLLQRGPGSRQEVHLRYAMGKYFDDLGEWAQAFEQYARANELSKTQHAVHDRAQVERGIEQIIEVFDERWLRAHAEVGLDSSRPLLIVGMPRSGTTLAEQILAAHPQVYGAGELSYWSAAASSLAPGTVVREDRLRDLGRGYLQALESLSSDAQRVVDKMPGNFLYLGLIRAALPHARIIHMRRHPIDTCLSIFFQNFAGLHGYADDLGNIEHYYRQYLRLMEHWRACLPEGVMLEVRYEDLVQDPQAWSRRMVEHAGLEWDERCLEFHKGSRAVYTFSKWQARQKISHASVERWRRYEPFITPLMALLDQPLSTA